MRRSLGLFLLLALFASLGVNVGLGLHLGVDARHGPFDQHRGTPTRVKFEDLVDGTCGQDPLRLNPDRFEDHMTRVREQVPLTDAQGALIGQMILDRAQIRCTLRQERTRLHDQTAQFPLETADATRDVLARLLAFRQTLTAATLAETQAQGAFLDSLSDAQVAAMSLETLPFVVPGLRFRELHGSRGGGRPPRDQRR